MTRGISPTRALRSVATWLTFTLSLVVKLLADDPRYVGTPRPGFFGVLHTWGRTLEYHPHVHYVVPGGGPNHDASRWLPSRA